MFLYKVITSHGVAEMVERSRERVKSAAKKNIDKA